MSRRDESGVAPPERSRRGGWAIWVMVGVVAVMAVALFGFLADGGVEEAPAAPDAPDAVLLDPAEDLGN